MLGGWVNPHREQQTIPQGQTSSPSKSFFTPTAKARPDQAALATSAEARGATHRASPSLCKVKAKITCPNAAATLLTANRFTVNPVKR